MQRYGKINQSCKFFASFLQKKCTSPSFGRFLPSQSANFALISWSCVAEGEARFTESVVAGWGRLRYLDFVASQSTWWCSPAHLGKPQKTARAAHSPSAPKWGRCRSIRQCRPARLLSFSRCLICRVFFLSKSGWWMFLFSCSWRWYFLRTSYVLDAITVPKVAFMWKKLRTYYLII